MRDKEGKADAQPFHLVLLAKDLVGYRNLCRLVTDAHLDGYYYKPRIDREHLARHAEGLIGLSACLGGEIPKALEVDDWELGPPARRRVRRHLRARATSSWSSRTTASRSRRASTSSSCAWRREAGLPLVVTNDLHYVHQAQAEAHDVLLCVGTGNNLDTPDRLKFEGTEFYLKSAAEMAALFPDQREALLATPPDRRDGRPGAAAGPAAHPALPGARGRDRRELAARGVRARPRPALRRRSPRSSRRASTTSSGSSSRWATPGYFLIVADFVRFAREQGIQTTCRGQRPGLDRHVHPGHHARRPDPLPAAVRAVPQPRPRDDARHRRRLRGRPARRGHQLRQPQVRRRPRRPDHHLRHHARPGGHPRRGPGPGELATARWTGSPRRSRTSSGSGSTRRSRSSPPLKRDVRRRPAGPPDHRLRQAARGGGPQRLHPRRRRRHQPRAADRADAAPEGHQLRRHDDPVRDARDRGAGAPEVRLPGPLEPDDPARRGRPDPGAPRRGDRPRADPARRRRDLRAAGLGRDDRRLPAGVGGHAALHPRAAPDVGLRPRRHGRPLPAGPDGQHPRLHPAQARPGAGDLPPPAPRAVPGADLRDLRLPGGHHGRGHRPRRLQRPGGGHARLRDPQEEVERPALDEGPVRHPGGRARRPPGDDRRRLQGLRAVRALRLQQGPRHLLRPGRLPDGLPQGELHRRVHGQRPDRLPGQRREGRRRGRRVPPPGDRGPAAGRPRQPPRVHRRGRRRSASGCWP